MKPDSLAAYMVNDIIVDVRAPIEFAKGHIPNAINVPLLDDTQRALVGTCYKKKGKKAAVVLGVELIGPKMGELAKQGLELAKRSPTNKLQLYCHRGGQRSQSVSWLWTQLGIENSVWQGGWKHFRNLVSEQMKQSYVLVVLAGKTGVGKTELLHNLQENGEWVLDLEQLAHHKGSAFGAIGESPQPTDVQFEIDLAYRLVEMQQYRDKESIYPKKIWVESESRMIGNCTIPLEFWNQMQSSPRVYVDASREKRIQRLCRDYVSASYAELAQALHDIQKRLGFDRHKKAMQALDEGNRQEIVDIVLDYYDSFYEKSKSKHQDTQIAEIKFDSMEQTVHELLQYGLCSR
jgi:tRNA 2-selenouridine synthase